ncbi:MAG TPA: molybdopterin-dependent oxidoreductase [Thermomicrobiales bacterium]
MVARTETKMVTGKINGIEVTVPAGTTILEAARMAGIEVPNLCYQPLLRPWGSCRICTVQILGKRGGLIESCATPLGEGMEVLTHSEECIQARQFILQMYLIDHALDCPTCDKSGECYLQDNTYLHNVNANPYRRPKLAQPYKHFSDLIDYKWDRCIMCNRCTRVCDEMIGVTAIESTFRSMEATISPAFGQDLRDTTCTHCGMCIAVCPVGALTDRHFAHHPWELDSTETVCGFCDVGCTLNIESNKGIVRRTTHLWERGVNHGYTCKWGRWGHEQVQNPERIFYPRVRDENGRTYEVTWDDAISTVAETLKHYQGDQFAALASADSTNEEVYALQQFVRAVMGTNNIDRALTPAQVAVERAVRASLGRDVTNTNNMQEFFTDVKSALLVGPDIGKTEPVASYWFYNARIYREMKVVVISQDEFPLCHRGDLWLKPNPGTTATLLNGIARQIVDLGLAAEGVSNDPAFLAWRESLSAYDAATVERITGIDEARLKLAAEIYATGGAGIGNAKDGVYPPSLIYQTVAHQGADGLTGYGADNTAISNAEGDPAEITIACNNLAILTGNIGRAGGGVAALRGPANYQGATDMGAHPAYLPGGAPVEDAEARAVFEQAWLSRWSSGALTTPDFAPVKQLPAKTGKGNGELAAAIANGEIKAMIIDGSIRGRHNHLDPELAEQLSKLEFLVVIDQYDSPLASLAHVVLPKAMAIEKDGTFTNLDRTVQRVRAAVPPTGEALSVLEIVSRLAQAMGYNLSYPHPSHVMAEIARLVPDYAGVTYARLERGGLPIPVVSFADAGSPILTTGPDGRATLSPSLLATAAD